MAKDHATGNRVTNVNRNGGVGCAQDVYVAGPPCQPFSRLSVLRAMATYHPFENDPKTRPIKEFCRHVRDRKPKSWVLEEAGANARATLSLQM